MPTVTLTSDEIEVACDALWFAKQHECLTPAGAALWDRLQPLRHGDYGSDGPSVPLGNEEADVLRAALALVATHGCMDRDEQALADRITQA